MDRLIPFGVTDCIYSSNPASSTKEERDKAILAQYAPKLKSLRRVSLDELATLSDVLFVLAPGGDATLHVVDESFLQKMKKHAVLVNTARGSLVDSDALAKALREQWIWAAGLDVVEGEPDVGLDHPLLKEPRYINDDLSIQKSNGPSSCVVLPHIGSATMETRLGMATLAVNNLLGGIDHSTMPAELDVASHLK